MMKMMRTTEMTRMMRMGMMRMVQWELLLQRTLQEKLFLWPKVSTVLQQYPGFVRPWIGCFLSMMTFYHAQVSP